MPWFVNWLLVIILFSLGRYRMGMKGCGNFLKYTMFIFNAIILVSSSYFFILNILNQIISLYPIASCAWAAQQHGRKSLWILQAPTANAFSTAASTISVISDKVTRHILVWFWINKLASIDRHKHVIDVVFGFRFVFVVIAI